MERKRECEHGVLRLEIASVEYKIELVTAEGKQVVLFVTSATDIKLVN